MHKVEKLQRGEGWSIWYKPKPHMRWLERPVNDIWRGVVFVAVDTVSGKLYYENTCSTCQGKYLAHRVDSYFCSARCRQSYHRAKRANKK